MMPCKKQAKKDDDHDDQKNSKKGKGAKPGGTMGTGQGQPEDNSDDPNLDIDAAMLMQAKPLKKQNIDQASQKHGGGG